MPRLALVPLLLLAACTSPVEADELAFGEGEPRDAPRYVAIPDGEVSDEVEDELEEADDGPRVVVSRFEPKRFADASGGDDYFSGTALCPFTVELEGTPAVSVDGTTVVSFVAETLSSSDGEDEIDTVTWIDVETGSREALVIVDGEDPDLRTNSDDRAHCRALWKKAKRRAAQANERLAKQRWRSMTPMSVPSPSPFDYDDEEEAVLGPRARKVELIHQHGEAVFRVPHVKVLGRASMDWGMPDEFDCVFTPYASEVFGDRETGVVAIEVSQHAGPCYCYAETLFHAMAVPDELFEAIAERNEL